MRGSELLLAVHEWVDSWKEDGLVDSLASEIEESPVDRFPRSIRWILEGSARMVQVTVWEDGQSELDFVEVESGDASSEHRQIDRQGDLDSMLEGAKDWVRANGSLV